jgi:hypothetical protein
MSGAIGDLLNSAANSATETVEAEPAATKPKPPRKSKPRARAPRLQPKPVSEEKVKREHVAVYLPPDVIAELDLDAADQERSRSWIAGKIIESFYGTR